MSMISEQVKELRALSKSFAIKPIRAIFIQAADTIEFLSEKMQAANDELERWHTDHINEKIKNSFAWTSTLICHNCDHKDEYVEELEAEVEELKAADMERSADAKMIDGNKLLKDLEKETFTADLYEHGWDGHTVDYLLCLGDVKKVIDGYGRSAEDCGGWIPCNERMPDVEASENVKSGICTDNGKRFLITDTEGYVYESTFWLSTQEFKDDAIAWMPKPEPYHEP